MYILILIRYVYTDLLKQILSNLKIAVLMRWMKLEPIIQSEVSHGNLGPAGD